jgi:indolepyruvate ferredoxin oxidoreductase beta subunit
MGRALLIEGYDAKVSEVHGMSQRGGAVVTYVRYGDKVHSPIVDQGQAELLVSFELLEAARWFNLLAPGGQVVTNTQKIDPIPVIIGAAEYPGKLLEKFEAAGAKVDAIDALALAEGAGSSKTVNIVMMGRLSKYFPFPKETWERALEEVVPPKFLDMNRRAFELGAGA